MSDLVVNDRLLAFSTHRIEFGVVHSVDAQSENPSYP